MGRQFPVKVFTVQTKEQLKEINFKTKNDERKYCIMKNKKYPKLEDYDLSDYIELTGDILYKINGGAKIENSNEAVAQAQVGDSLTRKDGTVVEITQGDIDWAKNQLGSGGNTGTTGGESAASGGGGTTSLPVTVESDSGSSGLGSSSGNCSYGSNQNAGSSAFSSSSTYSNPTTAGGSKTSFEEQNFLKTQSNNSDSESTSFKGFFDSQNPTRYIVDLDNRKELQKAADLLAETELGIKVTAYGTQSGITKTFNNYTEINDYLTVKKSDSIINKFFNKITYFQFEGRDAKNIITESFDEIYNSAKSSDGDWDLLNFNLSKYHQNGFGYDELKFVCKDGREAVFTKDFSSDGSYELYMDPKYKGTYNYFNPTTNPIGHFFADMVPYYLTGNRNERNQ